MSFSPSSFASARSGSASSAPPPSADKAYGNSSRSHPSPHLHRRERSLRASAALRSDHSESARNAPGRRHRLAGPNRFRQVKPDAHFKDPPALDGPAHDHRDRRQRGKNPKL